MSKELSNILKEGEDALAIQLGDDRERSKEVQLQANEVYAYFSESIYPKLIIEDYSLYGDMEDVYSRVDDIVFDELLAHFGKDCVIIKNILAGLSDVWKLLGTSRGEDFVPVLKVIGARSGVVSNPTLSVLKEESKCPFHNGKLTGSVLKTITNTIRHVSPQKLYKKGVKKERLVCKGIKFYEDFTEKITEVYSLAEKQVQGGAQ